MPGPEALTQTPNPQVEFGFVLDGRSRYENVPDIHHDHLIDMKTGKVIEFSDPEIERLQREIAKRLGYNLVDHRLELYGVPVESENK